MGLGAIYFSNKSRGGTLTLITTYHPQIVPDLVREDQTVGELRRVVGLIDARSLGLRARHTDTGIPLGPAIEIESTEQVRHGVVDDHCTALQCRDAPVAERGEEFVHVHVLRPQVLARPWVTALEADELNQLRAQFEAWRGRGKGGGGRGGVKEASG